MTLQILLLDATTLRAVGTVTRPTNVTVTVVWRLLERAGCNRINPRMFVTYLTVQSNAINRPHFSVKTVPSAWFHKLISCSRVLLQTLTAEDVIGREVPDDSRINAI